MSNADDQTTKKPTLKTIAKLTGLAVPTVSRALGGASDISVSTRARVRRVADEIGYVPNRAGVRLRTGRTNVISLVLSTDHELMNHTARLISSVASTLRDTPYHLIITPYFDDEDPLKPIRHIVETESADAVIFNRITPNDPRVAYLLEKGFPFVTHGRSVWAKDHPYYDFDNRVFGAIAVEQLVALGRRSLIMVAPPMDQNYAQSMAEGAQEAAAHLGVTFEVLSGADSDETGDQIEQSLRDRLGQGTPFDGVICPSTNSSLATIAAVESKGFSIGKDVDVVSKEATPFLQRIRSGIITVPEDVGVAGEYLARAAIQRVTSPKLPHLQMVEVPGRAK